jgi:hypothetical protein
MMARPISRTEPEAGIDIRIPPDLLLLILSHAEPFRPRRGDGKPVWAEPSPEKEPEKRRAGTVEEQIASSPGTPERGEFHP